jgi:alpha-L-fucosidase
MKGRIKAVFLTVIITMFMLQNTRADNMKWWREARFGLFIHWGLYSVPAGEWKGETNHAEWIRTTAKIPIHEYEKFVKQFNPVKFNAEEWVMLAKEAGMKYIVITSKHHDGFCLFDSKYTDFDIMSTPFKRDIMKELSEAAHKEGLKICWYHSIMDWHHPDYLPRRKWEEKDRPADGADFDRYVAYMKNQLRELVENYGDIGVLWFDGEWEKTWTHERGRDLYYYVKGLQPSIIINNRVDKGRSGMAGLTKGGGFVGDFGTPEQEIPATGLPGVDWETCMTMNNHWGYNKNDHNWKSTKDLVQKLADIASKGGNFLLNVGPTAEGLFPQESVDRLRAMGRWMAVNGQSIYGTSASPFKKLSWGRCTQRMIYGGTRLYLHVFDWPADGKLVVPGITNRVKTVYLMSYPDIKINYVNKEADLILTVPKNAPDKINSVIVLDIDGGPDIVYAPEIKTNSNVFIDTLRVTLRTNNYNSEIHYTMDNSIPDTNSPVYGSPLFLSKTTIIKAAAFRDGKRVSSISKRTLIRDYAADRKINGLKYAYYEGSWEKMPDFSKLKAKKTGKTFLVEIDAIPRREENYGIVYSGKLNISEQGKYVFYLMSNDGSRLYIDDKMVIDNDGQHGKIEKMGALNLSKGKHKFRVEYFQAGGKTVLELRVSGHLLNRESIPVSMLFPE